MQTAKIGVVKCLVLQLIEIVESLAHLNNNKTLPISGGMYPLTPLQLLRNLHKLTTVWWFPVT